MVERSICRTKILFGFSFLASLLVALFLFYSSCSSKSWPEMILRSGWLQITPERQATVSLNLSFIAPVIKNKGLPLKPLTGCIWFFLVLHWNCDGSSTTKNYRYMVKHGKMTTNLILYSTSLFAMLLLHPRPSKLVILSCCSARRPHLCFVANLSCCEWCVPKSLSIISSSA